MEIALGVDVGGTKILAVAIDLDGRVLAETRVHSPTTRDEIVGALHHATEQLMSSGEIAADDVVGVGFGLPGLVDSDGVLHDTPNMKAAEGLDVRQSLGPKLSELAERYRSPGLREIAIAVDNDATCAALGEFSFGAARSVRHAVVITLGTGIGGGIVANHQLLRGAHGFAGEVGHMTIEVDGPDCVCGARGCWELYASGNGLGRLARLAIANNAAPLVLELAGGVLEDVHGEQVVEAFKRGDTGAASIVDSYARYLAVGLKNLAEIFDPNRIILAGGLVRSAEVLVPPALSYFATYRRGREEREVEVVIAELGEYAGSIGAAQLAFATIT